MAQPKQSLYEILGVPPDANSIDVGLAYERARTAVHRGQQDPGRESLLHEAFEVLSDPMRRAAYDASLITAQERADAAQHASPDLVLEGTDDAKAKRIPWPAIAVGAAVIFAVIYLALRPNRLPDPQKEAAPAVVEAPKPPPPKLPAASEILTQATLSAGQLVSVEMSGRSVPIGIALAIAPNTMVTTCHGIQAGRKLVVILGRETLAADSSETDETLDLCKLNVAGMGAKPFAIAAEDLKPGAHIYAMGVNAAGEPALTEGTVKQVIASPAGRVLELSMPIAPNSSGGAIFDTSGRLVGIATTPHKYGPGLQVALPATWIAQIRSRGSSQ
ncbi:MAG: trypsin-like peptidase domain-containing protein [Usitatibacter sp.]